MSCHTPPPVPIGNGVIGGPESAQDGSEEFDQLVINCARYMTISECSLEHD